MKRLILSFAMMFAFFVASNAQIIYTDLSNNPVVIDNNQENYTLKFFDSYGEFEIQNYSYFGEDVYFACFVNGVKVVAEQSGQNANIKILSENQEIGQTLNFIGCSDDNPSFPVICNLSTYTDWVDKRGFVGFTFKNGNSAYYGWADISVQTVKVEDEYSDVEKAVNITLYGYAYESSAGVAIKAGDRGKSALTEIASEENISIYPNPASEILTINSSKNINKVEILDVFGRNVLTETSNPQNINISSLDEGVYCVSVETEDGIKTAKFIKE